MYIGGDEMAKETIQSIRQAELKAEQIEKDAYDKHEELINKALDEAKTIVSNMTNEAKLQGSKELELAKSQGKSIMDEVVERAEKEIMLLKELSKGKEKEAIQLVLSEII
jgi:V/A-type H+-transporting ATPase subunit G/H